MDTFKEIVTANEALRRVGCASLCNEAWDRFYVEWTGQPEAFACGRTAEVQLYVEPGKRTVRINQAFAAGPMLYSWGLISSPNGRDDYRFHLQGGFSVCVVQIGATAECRGDTALVACLS